MKHEENNTKYQVSHVASRNSHNIFTRSSSIRRLAFIWPGILVCLLFFSLPQLSSAQSRQSKEQLQRQMKKYQDEIKLIEAAIKKNKANEKKSMGEILSLQAKIRSRQKLISNIGSQIGGLDESISATATDIANKTKEVERMKADYAEMLRKSYQNITLQNKMAFIFSSGSFSDAVRRYGYLLKVAEYRRGQAKQIQLSIDELEEKRASLQVDKEEKVNLLNEQTSQKERLEGEKSDKDKAVAQMQAKDKRLKKQADEKSKAAARLNNKIKEIIEEEIRIARKKAEEEARKRKAKGATEKSDVIPLTPEEQALSKNFSSNKGKLPWPVERGHIVSQFGKHAHPVLKGVLVENNGVDIKTAPESEARAVFSGSVVSVFFLPTTQNCVIVKHGEYFSVYSNIEDVSVKPGQSISTKQSLGKLHTDKNEDITKVHIEIWKGKDKMDPESWLAGD